MKADGLRIEIILGSGEARNLREELRIDMANLPMELQEQPSWYAYYSSLLAEATARYEEEKSSYDSLVAEVSSEIRAEEKAKRLTKITEKQVALDTDMDPRTKAARKRIVDARRAMENLKVAVRAFEQRMDALRTIGHMEWRQDSSVRMADSFGGDRNVQGSDSEGSRDIGRGSVSFGSGWRPVNRERLPLDPSKLSTKKEYLEELNKRKISKEQ